MTTTFIIHDSHTCTLNSDEICHCADGGGPIRTHDHDLLSQPHLHTETGVELLAESGRYGRVGQFGDYEAYQWMSEVDDDH